MFEGRTSTQTNSQVKKYIKWGIWGFVGLLLLITFFSSLTTIGTGKVGVVTNYGRVTGRELTEGIAFKAPWGIETVTEYDVKTLRSESAAPSATKDLQDVNATIVLNYRINAGKIGDIHQNVGKDYYKTIIEQQIIESFKAVSAKYTASELITERAAVKTEFFDLLKERIQNNPEHKKRYVIQDVAITNFTFSAAFNQAIEAVQIANQKIAQARQELETTKVEAEKTVAEANAQAEAQRVKQQTLTPELLQQEWIKKWNGALPTTQAGDGAQFYIPTK